MSDLAFPPALVRLRDLDPQLAQELESAFSRLARAGTALAWAQAQLPELLARPTRTGRLALLVQLGKELSGVPAGWAVTWTGRGRSLSFQALVGDGESVPAPSEVSRTVVGTVQEQGRPVWSDDALSDARYTGAQSVQAYNLRSIGCVPIGDRGVLYLHDPHEPGRFSPACRAKLTALCALAGVVLGAQKQAPSRVRPPPIPGLVGSTPPMQELAETIHAFAPMPWPALILGETGTGKEAVARAVHALGPTADGPFVAVNCGAIPEELAESTLFGHERGSFTGADRRREGLVSRAAGGTLFLDEVGELSPRLQVKLLRLLQEGTYERVGGDRELKLRARIVAATLRDLDTSADGFREDLYYRLAACVLDVPPLRDRSADVPELAQHLLSKALAELPGARTLTLSPEALSVLAGRAWPGNVRELENAIRGAIGRAMGRRSKTIEPAHLVSRPVSSSRDTGGIASDLDLAAATDLFQQRRVHAALDACGGNRSQAAQKLGVSRQWLYRLLAKWEGKDDA
jgi:DNA-binding NtrC family response regulator